MRILVRLEIGCPYDHLFRCECGNQGSDTLGQFFDKIFGWTAIAGDALINFIL